MQFPRHRVQPQYNQQLRSEPSATEGGAVKPFDRSGARQDDFSMTDYHDIVGAIGGRLGDGHVTTTNRGGFRLATP